MKLVDGRTDVTKLIVTLVIIDFVFGVSASTGELMLICVVGHASLASRHPSNKLLFRLLPSI